MTEKNMPSVASVLKALRLVLIVFIILYGGVFAACISFLITTFPAFNMHVSQAFFWGWIRIFLGRVLTGTIYFFVVWSIFKLIGLAKRGEFYSPPTPRHIRRIGHAVFGLAVIGATVFAINELTSPGVRVAEAIIQTLYTNLGTLLLGLGFLVIAKVLETGVRLQQEQDLTV